MKVFKYEIQNLKPIVMPVGSKILTAQLQHNVCCIWALCDEAAIVTEATEKRKITLYATGESIPHNTGKYISTIQMAGGSFVVHVFDEGVAE